MLSPGRDFWKARQDEVNTEIAELEERLKVLRVARHRINANLAEVVTERPTGPDSIYVESALLAPHVLDGYKQFGGQRGFARHINLSPRTLRRIMNDESSLYTTYRTADIILTGLGRSHVLYDFETITHNQVLSGNHLTTEPKSAMVGNPPSAELG